MIVLLTDRGTAQMIHMTMFLKMTGGRPKTDGRVGGKQEEDGSDEFIDMCER
jgi:hypothetical protein